MSFRRIILFIVCTLFLAGTNLPSEAATDVKSDSVKAGTKEKKSSTPKKTASNTKKKKKHKKKAEPKPEDVARHYPPPGSSGEDRNFDWYRKRAFPNEYIDPAAYTNALEEAKKLPVYRLEGRQNGQSNTDWQLLGPSKIGGRVTALATHPTDPNTFYVGSAAGGVWKTTDHGTTWKALTDNFSAISVGCITIDPHDANTVYIGMGECNNSADSYPGNGLWRSTDGGGNWTLLGLEKTQYIGKVVVDPTDQNIIYACAHGPFSAADSNRGIWKSTDHGVTWTRSLLIRSGTVKTATPVPAVDLVMNPADHNDLVAAMEQIYNSISSPPNQRYCGLWRTRDGGSNWHRIDTISGNGYVNGITFKLLSRTTLLWANTPGKPTLYAVTTKLDKNALTGYTTDENLCAIFKSTDPDSNWRTVLDSTFRIPYQGNNVDSADLFYRQGSYDNFIVGHPTRPNELYVGGIDVIRTTDGGATWSNITKAYPRYFANDRSQHSDQHALAFTAATGGNDLLNGSDGGVFNTTDFGASWTQMKGLPITMFYHLEPWAAGMASMPDPLQPGDLKVMGGTQDNGTVAHGFSANTDWDWINRGDGGFAQAHPTNENILITSLQLGKIFVRTTLDSLRPNLYSDAGNTDPNAKKWFDLSVIAKRRGITDSSESCAFIPPVILDKERGNELYTGRVHIYRMKLSFTDPDSGTVIQQWSPILGGNTVDPSVWYYGQIEALSLGVRDKNQRPMLWVGSYFSGSTRVVWRTTVNESLHPDSLPKWIRADSAGLPNLVPAWIIADRSDSLSAFIGMSGFSPSGHLFKTTNGGKQWKSINGNLPNAPINAFVIDSLAEDHDPLKKNQCIFVAMDVGVYVTTDGGKSWSKLGTAIPNLVVNTLTMYRNWLIAGTAGRSAWAIDVSSIKALQLFVKPEKNLSQTSDLLSVHPNPIFMANGSGLTLTLRGTGEENIHLDLLNAETGALVHSTTCRVHEGLDSQEVTVQIPQNIASGSYIVRLSGKNGLIGASQISIIK